MRKILLATTFMVASAAAFSGAEAYTFGKTAAVTVVATPPSIVDNQGLDFATIEKPASGSVFVEVLPTADGATAASTATVVSGTPVPGNYTIKGDANNQIAIAITPGSAPTGLTLSDFAMNYAGSSYTSGFVTAPGATGQVLKIGAKLTIDSTVASGTHSPAYNIEVTYQ